MNGKDKKAKGDLSITALYTAYVWYWGQLSGAHHFVSRAARIVFHITNIALLISKIFIRHTRSLKHSLLHRHIMIDILLKKAVPNQVLELAAGLSRRGITISNDPNIVYTEVDLPQMIAYKRYLLQRSEKGKDIIQRPNLHLIKGDIFSTDLTSLVQANQSLFVIAEGIFMYLTKEQQHLLWQKIYQVLKICGGGILIFDLIPSIEQPKPGFFGRILAQMMKFFTGGQDFIRDKRSREDIIMELKKMGYANVTCKEPHLLIHDWQLPFPKIKTQQLIFVCAMHN